MVKPMNCINCGAVLTSNKCEYCGTVYETDSENNINLGTDSVNGFTVTLTISGEKHKFYVSDVDVRYVGGNIYYDENGNLCRKVPVAKRKLTLIEY